MKLIYKMKNTIILFLLLQDIIYNVVDVSTFPFPLYVEMYLANIFLNFLVTFYLAYIIAVFIGEVYLV